MRTARTILQGVIVAGGLALGSVAAGCADDGPGAAADPIVLATFPPAAMALENVPVPGDATPLQSPSGENLNTTVSYRIDDESAQDVLDFYGDQLAALEWSVADPAVETSDHVWRGDWLKDGQRLQVIASPMSLGTGAGPPTQFNLVLLEDRTDITVATAPSAGGSD